MILIDLTDADFDWLAGGPSSGRHFTIAPGGAEHPDVLPIVRRISRRHFAAGYSGSWMMVADDEVVGLCNFIRMPQDGMVEIGYGVGASRRGRGHATAAVAAMLETAGADEAIRVVTADTAVTNPASQRVLEKNGFLRAGSYVDPEDGELIRWRYELRNAGDDIEPPR